ncbi:Na(+)/H(+) antiporter subunit B [Natronospora cellulosivora (SeqCode)]
MIILEYILIILLLGSAYFAVSFEEELISIVCLSVFSVTLTALYLIFKAPDVALAEVVIGAGLTTALFMAAISRLRSVEEKPFRGED